MTPADHRHLKRLSPAQLWTGLVLGLLRCQQEDPEALRTLSARLLDSAQSLDDIAGSFVDVETRQAFRDIRDADHQAMHAAIVRGLAYRRRQLQTRARAQRN